MAEISEHVAEDNNGRAIQLWVADRVDVLLDH